MKPSAAMCVTSEISSDRTIPSFHRRPATAISPKSPVISLPDSERHTIAHALAATRGQRGKTARLLGIGRTTLYRKMKEYNLA